METALSHDFLPSYETRRQCASLRSRLCVSVTDVALHRDPAALVSSSSLQPSPRQERAINTLDLDEEKAYSSLFSFSTRIDLILSRNERRLSRPASVNRTRFRVALKSFVPECKRFLSNRR